MKFADRLKFTATGTSAATITVGAAVTACRTLAQAVSDGALIVGDTGVPFTVTDGTNWEDALFTVTSGTVLTRTSVLASSAGGTTAATFSGPLTVFNAAPGSFLSSVLSAADGTDVASLTNAAPATTFKVLTLDGSNALHTSLVSDILALQPGGGTSQTVAVNNPGAQTVNTAFNVTGTYTNILPAALDYSINGGSTWIAAPSPVINAPSGTSGTFSFGGVTVPGANASQTVMVRDHTRFTVTGTSASFAVNAAAGAAATGVTLTGPTTGQVSVASSNFSVGVTPGGGTITGTVVVTPSDNGGGGTFTPTTVSLTTAAPTGTFTYTPSATAGARTISVTNNSASPVLTNPSNITYTSTAASSNTLSINTPIASPQLAGVAFTLSGTWTGTQPTSIGIATTDNSGAQSSFTTLTTGTSRSATNPNNLTINANGTWTCSWTPLTTSTSRTLQAKDMTNGTLSAVSNAYAVNAPVFQFNGGVFQAMPANPSIATGASDYGQISPNPDFQFRTSGGAGVDEFSTDVYVTLSTYNASTIASGTIPRPNDAQHVNHAPSYIKANRIGSGNASYLGDYGVGSLYTWKSDGGGTANRYLWVIVFAAGADPATATPIWSGVYDGNHTGTPIAITVT